MTLLWEYFVYWWITRQEGDGAANYNNLWHKTQHRYTQKMKFSQSCPPP